ncbi:Alpha/Beta hydrolase protein [Trichoderma chlorosporum]
MRQVVAWTALGFGLLPISVAAQGNVNVTIDSGTIIGASVDGLEIFHGIPYADPPVGDLRLQAPQKLSTHLGEFDATRVAKLCYQGPTFDPECFSSPGAAGVELEAVRASFGSLEFEPEDRQSEDCLTITIHRPAGTKAGDDLPVLFYIFGGGFLIGGTSADVNDPATFVQTGINLGKPFIFAAVNYRVGGWGFMPGAEVQQDGGSNAGLLDQRMGLEWVADNIAAFGGNPEEVTIWGQSAGAISVFDQLVLYDGNNIYNDSPLFRAAIMNSGSVLPTDPVDSEVAQGVYKRVITAAGCDHDESLGCLRNLTKEEFAEAANSVPALISYESLALSYLPRPDGVALTASPHVLAQQGKFPEVPMIFGTQEDEGTLFSLCQKDMGTTDDITTYLDTLYFPNAGRSLVKEFVETYSELVEDGSPYRRGTYVPYPAYPGKKRLASILGDIVFTLIRRWTLETIAAVSPKTQLWSSFASYNYLLLTAPLGTQHGSDATVFFKNSDIIAPTLSGRKYYINFVYCMDPNEGLPVNTRWPDWREDKQLLWYNLFNNSLIPDDFRSNSSDFIREHIDSLTF